MATELSTLMGTLTDAVNNLQKKQTSSIEMTASGQAWVGARRMKRAFVIASGTGVIRLRNGGSTGTIMFGSPSGVTVTAGQVIEFDDEYFGSGVYFDLVSGTITIRLTSEPAT